MTKPPSPARERVRPLYYVSFRPRFRKIPSQRRRELQPARPHRIETVLVDPPLKRPSPTKLMLSPRLPHPPRALFTGKAQTRQNSVRARALSRITQAPPEAIPRAKKRFIRFLHFSRASYRSVFDGCRLLDSEMKLTNWAFLSRVRWIRLLSTRPILIAGRWRRFLRRLNSISFG